MKIGLVSLGCSKNLVDSELMLGALRAAGFVATDELDQAEILIVNSCGFIESAKKESIETLLRLAEYKKSGACRVLILAGCLGQRYSGDLMNDLPEVDAIVGTGAWDRLTEAIQTALQGMRTVFTEGNSIFAGFGNAADSFNPELSGICQNCRRLQSQLFILCDSTDSRPAD